ncbi:RcnB family protein [Sphingomonas sp. QA11]|uniref:RcnB family protein n=1 Tax=Sphingomonas sp. QA11 TaxID=2950605 RepID=UPI00234A3601|nr:RcnB family protein [Sphingomonas sp. QA11]WCM26221.1 RcnB family protein [Sphingomonas sp. QA11]
MVISFGRKAHIAAMILVLGLGAQTVAADAQQRREGGAGSMSIQRGGESRDGGSFAAERYREPRGYARPVQPAGAEIRPQSPDRAYLSHNFTADRPVHVGPYHGPQGWQYRRFRSGQVLPAIFWAPEYRLLDYWLFGLDIPPVGYEWIRYGPDALLIDLDTGQIVQVVYGNFL